MLNPIYIYQVKESLVNNLLLSAGLILIITGVVHSVLGEVLIFKKIRNKGVVPDIEISPLQVRNFQIIWATWHLVTVFGFLISVLIFKMAEYSVIKSEFLLPITITMFVASFIVFFATNARHPGWIGLLTVGLLCWLS